MDNLNRYNYFLDFWKLPRQSVVIETDPPVTKDGAIKIHMPRETLTDPEFYNWDSIHFFAPIDDTRLVKKTDVSELISTNTKDREIHLPFNLNLAVHNLVTEQYLKREPDHNTISWARSLYYIIKPWLPRSIQLSLRRQAIARMSKRNFPTWPVDTSAENLNWALLKRVLSLAPDRSLPVISFWPTSAKFCFVITHDVELQTGCDQISNILSIEQKYGVHSAWNFVPERYEVDSRLLKKLQTEGFEVGVHGLKHDGRLFESYQTFRNRADRINIYLQQWGSVGFRSPSNLRNLDWISEHLQLEYDSSCISSELYGAQPGGSCTIFPFMHGNLVELPITLQQDFTLLEILRLSSEAALENWLQTVQIIQAYNGMVLINVHPDYMSTPARLILYDRFLDIMTNYSACWNALPVEVARWWRDRQASEIIHSGSGWRIEGPAAEWGTIMRVMVKENSLLFEPFLINHNLSSLPRY
jgi:hypothetical protein